MTRGRRPRPGAPAETAAPTPPTVLIVDDVSDNREMYAEYLRANGYAVLEAADGATGLEIARTGTPDAIVLDLSMPRLDGWLATRKLKEDALTRSIPIIVLSGFAMPESRRSALDAGADLVLAKPCLPEDLRRNVDRLLAARGCVPPPAA